MIDSELDGYRQLIRRTLATGGVVFNGTIEHACVVAEELLLSAQSNVRLLTHNLDSCFAREKVIAAAENFVSRPGAEMSVLVESDVEWARSEFVRRVCSAGGPRVRFAVVPAEVRDDYTYNFMVADQAYRFQEDRCNPVAVVAAGSDAVDDVASLTHIYDVIEQASHHVPPPGVEERPLELAAG